MFNAMGGNAGGRGLGMSNMAQPGGQQYASNLVAALRGNTARAGLPMMSNPGFTEFAYRAPQFNQPVFRAAPVNFSLRPMMNNAQSPKIFTRPTATVDQIDAWRIKNGYTPINPPPPPPPTPPFIDSGYSTW